MADETVAVVHRLANPDAEALATVVFDEAGRLIRDPGRERARLRSDRGAAEGYFGQ